MVCLIYTAHQIDLHNLIPLNTGKQAGYASALQEICRMDYIAFCKNYFTVTNLPVNLVNDDGVLYSSLGDLLGIPASNPIGLYPSEYNPEFRAQDPDIVYGSVRIEATGDYIMLGPAFSFTPDEELIRRYMHECASPFHLREEIAEALCSIPLLSQTQFCRHLVLIHQCVNGKLISVSELMMQKSEYHFRREERHMEAITENLEQERLHKNIRPEQEIYAAIRQGNPETLKDTLLSLSTGIYDGKLAQTPLRQIKNLFISTATKATTLGAIPGGMDSERAYQLMDLYIQECEKMQSIDTIQALQYTMLMDLCQKTGEYKVPLGISSEVNDCINFIRSRVNSAINVEDVAEHIHRSVSYTTKKFKSELGFTMGAFITRCKLEEAKSLLAYSDKSLAEISSYLCFSNQAHFQNLFKKHYDVTPMKYRRKHHVLHAPQE